MRLLRTPSRALAASLLAASPCAFAEIGARSGEPSTVGASADAVPALWAIDYELRPARGWTDSFMAQRSAGHTARLELARSLELHANTPVPDSPSMALEPRGDALRRLHGFTDVSFGATWRVRGGDAGWLPGVAWLADVESTTGMPDFRGPVFRPSLRATAQWALQPDLSLGLMPGIYRDRDEVGKHYAAGVLALTLGKAWTPRLHTFFEVAGERLTQSQHGGSSVTLDTGIAFRATRSLRFEAIVSHGLAGDSRNAQGGVGVSSRF